MKNVVLILCYLSCQLYSCSLWGQTAGFNRTYPDAEGYTVFEIVMVDQEYWAYCFQEQDTALLITDWGGEQLYFGPIPGSACELAPTDLSYVAKHKISLQDQLFVYQTTSTEIQLKRYQQPDCQSSAADLVWEQSYSFPAGTQQVVTAVQAQKSTQGGIYLTGYEYLGETPGADPGPHTFRIWMLKTDRNGNELWRGHSEHLTHARVPSGQVIISTLLEDGLCMAVFSSGEDAYPTWSTREDDGTESYQGRLSNTLFSIDAAQRSLLFDGAVLRDEVHSPGNGHATFQVFKSPAPNSAVPGFSLYYMLDSYGVYRGSRASGLIHKELGAWIDGFDLFRHDRQGNQVWKRSFPHINSRAVTLAEGESESVLLGGRTAGKAWLMKVPNAPDFRVTDARVPESFPPIAVGGEVGYFYSFGYAPDWGRIEHVAQLGVYLSRDAHLDAADTLVHTLDFDYFYPNHAGSWFGSADLPAAWGLGTYYVIFKIDNLETTIETDEENNVFAMPFQINALYTDQTTGTDTTVLLAEQSLCPGDLFQGIPIFQDTFFTDTIHFIDSNRQIIYDSILLTPIAVLPEAFTQITIQLEPGMEYEGQIIYADTSWTDTLTAANGCDSLVQTVISLLTSSTNPLLVKAGLKVFPNPFTDQLTLVMDQKSSTPLSVRMLNLSGRQVLAPRDLYPPSGPTASWQLNLAPLPAGCYLLVVETTAGPMVEKVCRR